MAELAAQLGLEPGRRATWACPSCRATTRAAGDRRGPVGVTGSGGGWRCHRCQAGGDGADLVAWALAGCRSREATAEQADETRAWAAERGLVAPDPASPATARSMAYVPPAPRVEAPPRYPSAEQLADVRAACRVRSSASAAGWRWLGERFGRVDLARPRSAVAGRTADLVPGGYPLVVPLCDATGETRSVHCRRADEAHPKTRNPTGYDVRGLFFADTTALRMLRGTPPGAGLAVVVEGVTDYLRACQIAPPDVAVLGGVSGSFPAIGALACLPTDVWVLTDADDKGDHYAAQVAAGCSRAVRVRPPDGEDLGSAGWTWDDVVRTALF